MNKHICKAKRIDNGEWAYGYYFERKDNFGNIIESIIIEDAYEQVHGGQKLLESMFGKECFRVNPKTVCQCTEMTEFVMTNKSINRPLFDGDIVEINSLRRPYAGYPQSTYDGPVKVRAVIYFKRGQWLLDYDNSYNYKMCETRGNEQYERSVDGAWELYYFGYKGKPEHEDEYRKHNKMYDGSDIVQIGNIYDNKELLDG